MPAISKIKVGDIFKNNEGCFCSVTYYKNSSDVGIVFHDSFAWNTSVRSGNLVRGNFKNLFHPSVCGVGFMGVGKHKMYKKGLVTREYRIWLGMLQRCYSKNKKTKSFKGYEDCSVHEDWHNFQVFAEWYTNHEFYNLGYELDKDIKVKGNRVYSERTCCLVPAYINLLIHTKQEKVSCLPTGVSNPSKEKYQANLTKHGKIYILGRFNSVEEASRAYVEEKEIHVKEEAKRWRSRISEDVFRGLLKWTVY